ncbi:DNA-directed DNA polymerase [Tanacetum coccineum]|uniref:DNA-directed DNA polymerase n=1 Tax=Tanacetum coccineum TaxID=301880 RepID=A0ABQ5BLT6_9ASTR
MLNDGESPMQKEELVNVGTEMEIIDAMEIVENIPEKVNHEVVVFTEAPYREYCEPYMSFSTPCMVEGNQAWDAELNMAYHDNYMVEDMLNTLRYVRLDYGDYGQKWLRIMRIDVTMLKEDMEIDTLLANFMEDMVEVGDTSGRKSHTIIHKHPLKWKKVPHHHPQHLNIFFIHYPLSKKKKILEALEIKYQELEGKKKIVEVLENYMIYRKKLNEMLMGRVRLENKDHTEEDKVRILENGLPKKQCDPGNLVLPIRVNGTIHLDALADKGASVSGLPYTLYKNLGLGNPHPYHSNHTMANNTQAKAMGEVRNVRIQIGYQAYLVDFLVLNIPIDTELPLLLGRPFLRTCGAMIDMGHGIMTIDDGVQIYHSPTMAPKT